jgi:hypothetical protein
MEIPFIGNINIPFLSTPEERFNQTAVHGKTYEIIYSIKGEVTPEKYADIRAKLIEKLPDFTFNSVTLNDKTNELIVNVTYNSPLILVYGIAILIISALAIYGITVVTRDIKEVSAPATSLLKWVVISVLVFFGIYLFFYFKKKGAY